MASRSRTFSPSPATLATSRPSRRRKFLIALACIARFPHLSRGVRRLSRHPYVAAKNRPGSKSGKRDLLLISAPTTDFCYYFGAHLVWRRSLIQPVSLRWKLAVGHRVHLLFTRHVFASGSAQPVAPYFPLIAPSLESSEFSRIHFLWAFIQFTYLFLQSFHAYLEPV